MTSSEVARVGVGDGAGEGSAVGVKVGNGGMDVALAVTVGFGSEDNVAEGKAQEEKTNASRERKTINLFTGNS